MVVAVVLAGCGVGLDEGEGEREPDLNYSTIEQGLVTCGTRQDTGYRTGAAFTITVVTADGRPVERDTANAYAVMQQAAAEAGVTLTVVSGFRTMAEQQYLYACYVNCNCNSCNLAARPGYSNHQSGHALDLNTSAPGVYNWLSANAARFGFSRTVPSEPWHWEWWGGGPGGGPCPTTPPSCDRTAGLFTFSCDGPEAGKHCVKLEEPADPDTWGDNYLCTADDWGLRWSFAGPIEGMDCTGVHESAEPLASVWADNFLCAPPQSPLGFSWHTAGPLAGQSCVRWFEWSDLGGSWGDNWLCTVPLTDFSGGGLTFSSDGPNEGQACVAVEEPEDSHGWADNHLCTTLPLALEWSAHGPLPLRDCIQVAAPGEPHPGWDDDYLCVQKAAEYGLTVASAPLPGQDCARWYEAEDTSGGWPGVYVCARFLPPEERTTALVPPPPPPPPSKRPVPGEKPVPEGGLGVVTGGCTSAPGLVPLGLAALLWWRRRRRSAVA